MNWAIEKNTDGTYNLINESGTILVTGHMETIEEYLDEVIESLNQLRYTD
jgi:ethanolamine utilization microcompartment shell protein EutS